MLAPHHLCCLWQCAELEGVPPCLTAGTWGGGFNIRPVSYSAVLSINPATPEEDCPHHAIHANLLLGLAYISLADGLWDFVSILAQYQKDSSLHHCLFQSSRFISSLGWRFSK